MRQILFRGKSPVDTKNVKKGEWVFGGITCMCYSVYITDIEDGTATPVDPETVGEYTNFEDFNGNSIFEGDVVQQFISEKPMGIPYKAVFVGSQFLFESLSGLDKMEAVIRPNDTIKIVGNVHDNPQIMAELIAKHFDLQACKRCHQVPTVTSNPSGRGCIIACDCRKRYSWGTYDVVDTWKNAKNFEIFPEDLRKQMKKYSIQEVSKKSGVSTTTLRCILKGRECRKATLNSIVYALEKLEKKQ